MMLHGKLKNLIPIAILVITIILVLEISCSDGYGDGMENKIEGHASNDEKVNRERNFELKEISFASTKNITLYGTLRIPKATHQVGMNQKMKAIVFVHGSGGGTRNEDITVRYWNTYGKLDPKEPKCGSTIVSTSTFKETADYLASKGIVVLTYDKRSCCDATIHPECNQCQIIDKRFTNSCYYGCDAKYDPQLLDINNLTISDFTDDAINGLKFLASQSFVNSSDLSILGHSQGVNIAPVAAANFNQQNKNAPHIHVKSVVLFHGAIRPIDETIVAQYHRLIDQASEVKEECEREGKPPSDETIQAAAYTIQTLEGVLPIISNAFELLKNGSIDPNDVFCIGGCSTGKFFLEWIKYSGRKFQEGYLLDRLNPDNVNILSLNSPADWNVAPEDYQNLIDILKERKAKQFDTTSIQVNPYIIHSGSSADLIDFNVSNTIMQQIEAFLL